MPTLIDEPAIIAGVGEPPKMISEYVGRASTGEAAVSIAWMRSPAGWTEPPQTPDFDEYSVVVSGSLTVEFDGGSLKVGAGEAISVAAGERVRYSTPEGAEYLAICIPAYSTQLANRDSAPDHSA